MLVWLEVSEFCNCCFICWSAREQANRIRSHIWLSYITLPVQKNPLPPPCLCHTVKVSLFLDSGWAWSWKGEKRKDMLWKALLSLHLGWALLSIASLRDEKHAWRRIKQRARKHCHIHHAIQRRTDNYKNVFMKDVATPWTSTWVYSRNTKLKLMSNTVGPNSELSLSWGKARGCSNRWEVTLVPEAGEAIYCTAKTELCYHTTKYIHSKCTGKRETICKKCKTVSPSSLSH